MELQYRYTPELNQTVTVLPDGYVNLNLVGNVKVSDLTLEQAHDLIVQKAKVRLNDPELNLILREFQRPYVVVAGQVTTPGKIELRENTTAMQAVLLAGGFLPSAQSGQVLLFRKINSDTAEVKVLKLTNIHKTAAIGARRPTRAWGHAAGASEQGGEDFQVHEAFQHRRLHQPAATWLSSRSETKYFDELRQDQPGRVHDGAFMPRGAGLRMKVLRLQRPWPDPAPAMLLAPGCGAPAAGHKNPRKMSSVSAVIQSVAAKVMIIGINALDRHYHRTRAASRRPR